MCPKHQDLKIFVLKLIKYEYFLPTLVKSKINKLSRIRVRSCKTQCCLTFGPDVQIVERHENNTRRKSRLYSLHLHL